LLILLIKINTKYNPLYKEIIALISKDFQLELRQKTALNGIVLYVLSTCYICYASFKLKTDSIDPITWNTLFWIIQLFTAIMAVGKSFGQEKDGRLLYLYTLTSAEAMILSKIIYNSLMLLVLAIVGFGFYLVIMGNPVQNIGLFLIGIFIGSVALASTLSLFAGLAAKTENASMIMAILSFPVIIPILLLLIRISKNAMDGLDFSSSYPDIILLGAINVIVVILSVILYPYLWRS
jgi:heme exporter protein B